MMGFCDVFVEVQNVERPTVKIQIVDNYMLTGLSDRVRDVYIWVPNMSKQFQ
jgi:hypothetical protein